MANQFLTLSLFIMLLSFFIILNTMASYDESKSNPIIRSLAVALTLNEEDALPARSVEFQPDAALGEGSSVDRIRGLFQNHIAGFKSSENRFGTELYATIPVDEFEEALKTMSSKGFPKQEGGEKTLSQELLPTLASILRSEDNGMAYSMHILLNTQENPALLVSDEPDKIKPLMRKAASFADRIEKVGLPSYLVNAGIDRGDPKLVALVFRPYEPYAPIKEEGGNP